MIGLPSACYADSWYTPANGNAISYLRAIEAAGGIPALIHQTVDREVLDTHYQRCDGFIFAGGTDIDPAQYAAACHPKLETPDPRQDALELLLARRAVADGKPIFGICRGNQLVNVALGGSLYQDIPSECAGSLNHSESTDQRNMSYLAHDLALESDSWLAERLGATNLMINTLHHQALQGIAPGLRVVGRAPDGIIEVVEGTGPSFVLGVQCHPEELWQQADPRWARVFAGFVEQCGRV
jgi:putative glutamine amidotransferase